MPKKQRRSFSIDEDIHEWIRGRGEFNASAAVNRYLRDRMEGFDHGEAVLRAEERRLERELETREREVDTAEARVGALEEQLATVRTRREKAAEADHSNVFYNTVAEVVRLIEDGDLVVDAKYGDAIEAMRDPSSNPAEIVDRKLAKVPDVNNRGEFIDAVERRLGGT